MQELKDQTLRSSSGQKVRKRSQAIAIGLSEQRKDQSRRIMQGVGDALAGMKRRS